MPVTINGTTGIAGPDGSASTPAVQGTDSNTGLFYPAADTAALSTGGSERMRIDSSGNVGIGVTPSTWTLVAPVLQMAGGATLFGYSNGTFLGSNTLFNSGWKYINTAAASRYDLNSGQHSWWAAPSGTAGTAITFTQVLAVEKDKSLALQGATSQSGTGITFPATQSASSDANTLDDYEEGTWTVTTASFTVTGTTTLTGTYTKIGRVVFFDISFANTGTIAYGTSCLINLPFVGVAQGGMVTMRVSDNQALQTSGKSGCQINIDNNSPQPARIFPGNFTTTSAGETLYFSGFYRVS